MGIKDAVFERYAVFLIRGAQVINRPGFIYFNLGKRYARQVVMPESFFISVEEKMQKITNGPQMLYSAGKKFGHTFSIMGKFPKRGQINDDKIKSFIHMVNKFIEGTYASEIKSEIDLSIPLVKYAGKDLIVISKIGYGYFLPRGAIAGMISYVLNDKNIDSYEESVDGAVSSGICAPYEIIKNKHPDAMSEPQLDAINVDQRYGLLNHTRQTLFTKTSLESLLKSLSLPFHNGRIERDGERYFIFEVSGVYLLEKELSKEKKAIEILYNSAFESGKKMVWDKKMKAKDVSEILSAFGWGDVYITFEKGFKVNIISFPWTEFQKDVNFEIFNGLLSGMLSEISDRNVKMKIAKMNVTDNFSISFEEEINH